MRLDAVGWSDVVFFCRQFYTCSSLIHVFSTSVFSKQRCTGHIEAEVFLNWPLIYCCFIEKYFLSPLKTCLIAFVTSQMQDEASNAFAVLGNC